MARSQSFNRNSVLNCVIAMFWKKGYNATSISDLVEATGLLRGSLYAAFKSKHGLYLTALNHYMEGLRNSSIKLLQSNKKPIDCIDDFFEGLVVDAITDKDFKGCLLINSLLEIPVEDKETNELVTDMFNEIGDEFKRLIAIAKQDKTISDKADIDAIGDYLVASIYGLRAFSKMKPSPAQIRAVKNNIINHVRES